MTEIILDGKRAVIDKETSIKLNVENVYFTKTSSYTYDIELPLSIRENRMIFGDINRIDISKQSRTMDAELITDNVSVLKGKAHITSISQKSVKIQMLGEAASYNYNNKVNETYIDQIELGDWYWETWPEGSYRILRSGSGWGYYEAGKRIKSAKSVLSRLYYKGPGYNDEKYTNEELLTILRSGNLGWVAYPTYNAAAEMRHNAVAYKETAQGSRLYEPYLRGYEGESSKGNVHDAEPLRASFSIQPMLWKIVEIIARATGMTLHRQDNELYKDVLFKKIFIANTTTTAEINGCLPHWTVNEFWTQIENMFGVVMTVDYKTNSLKLIRRCDHYSEAPKITLKNIVAEYDATVNDENENDISVSNVGYADFESSPEDVLSEEILSNAEFMEFDDKLSLLQWCEQQSDMDKKKNFIFKCKTGEQYIYSTNVKGSPGIIEVNMLRPRIVKKDNEDIDIELKIVPARCSTQNADIFATYVVNGAAGNPHRDIPDGVFEVKMIQVPGQATPELVDDDYEQMDIQAILDGEEEAETKEKESQDLIYVAMINPENPDAIDATVALQSGGELTRRFYYYRGRIRERSFARLNNIFETEDYGGSLSLIEIRDLNDIASHTITGMVKIDTTVRQMIKFVSDRIPDVGAIFLIRNKWYVCEKIEATIKPHGLDKLLTGYFYEYAS